MVGMEKESKRERSRVVSPKGLRKSSIPYLFIWAVYYAWVIAFTTWWTSPGASDLFSGGTRSMLHSVNLLSSAFFVFVIHKDRYVSYAKAGALALVCSMGAFLLFYQSPLGAVAAVAVGISLGCVNISILMPFVFHLNNTEKFYGAVGSFVLIGLHALFVGSGGIAPLNEAGETVVSFVIMLAALSMILYFKRGDVPPDPSPKRGEERVSIPPRVYLTLAFNCIFAILGKGVGTGILDLTAARTSCPVMMWFAAGELAGCAFYILIYRFLGRSIHLTWNIVFGCLMMGLLCNAFAPQSDGAAAAFGALLGIGNTMGMVNVYYILGVIGKKYNSMRYIRLSILFIGICGGVAGVATGNLVSASAAMAASIGFSVVSAVVILLFLILSPVLSRTYYGDEWVEDAERPEIGDGKDGLFEGYHLSKREMEICRLLLKGYTLRQISAILSIGYSTVNTHCTSLYRKLSINSRTELLLLFQEKLAR